MKTVATLIAMVLSSALLGCVAYPAGRGPDRDDSYRTEREHERMEAQRRDDERRGAIRRDEERREDRRY